MGINFFLLQVRSCSPIAIKLFPKNYWFSKSVRFVVVNYQMQIFYLQVTISGRNSFKTNLIETTTKKRKTL